MRITVLGTGAVGLTLAGGLAGAGHQVRVGTRDVVESAEREDVAGWLVGHPDIPLSPLDEAAAWAQVVVNATNGSASLLALEAAGEPNLAGKVLIDVANPLDFSGGFPPTLLVCDIDSLGEQVQRRFPDARVVKTLNTMNASIMVDPTSVADGEHTAFLSGDDAAAKAVVRGLLEELGWTDILDLGDITTARGPEMVLPLWVRTFGALGTPEFQLRIAR